MIANIVVHEDMKDELMSSPGYYVYTLSYPTGEIFYVGKGHQCRIFSHEADARSAKRKDNQQKCEIIREIWKDGGDVIKSILAWFDDELEAYMYEWALMNMTTYAERLANINRGGGYPCIIPVEKKAPLLIPHKHTLRKHWGCFKSPSGKVFHEVVDIRTFAKLHRLSAPKLIDLASGHRDYYVGWMRSEACPSILQKGA